MDIGHIQYPSPNANIEKFARMIATGRIYFSQGRDTVYEIGECYCTEPPPPAWADAVSQHMLAIYNAAGINVTIPSIIEGGGNEAIVELAMAQIGKPYVYGADGPNSFDCSGLVSYVYSSLGISVPRSTSQYKTKMAYEISWDDAQPGDILIIFKEERPAGYNSGHAGIYLGDNQYIHSPETGKTVTTSKNAKRKFTHVFRFTS